MSFNEKTRENIRERKKETLKNLVDLEGHLVNSIEICKDLGRWITVSKLKNMFKGVQKEVELLKKEVEEE